MRLRLQLGPDAIRDGRVNARPQWVAIGLNEDHVVAVESGNSGLLVLAQTDDDAVDLLSLDRTEDVVAKGAIRVAGPLVVLLGVYVDHSGTRGRSRLKTCTLRLSPKRCIEQI